MKMSFVAGLSPVRAIRVLPNLLALALSLSLAACANLEVEPPGAGAAKPSPVVASPVPPEAPRTTGVEKPPSNEHRQLVAMMGGEYRLPAAAQYLNSVLAKLAAASELPGEAYKVTILNTPAVNAFALPSGNVYITRGLLALANDTSEVAGVMAHEIGHVTARHAVQRAEQMKRQQLITEVSSRFQDAKRGAQVRDSTSLTLASFSREQELEADRIGVMTIAKAGYDPYGASRFLASLERSTAMRAALLGQNSTANDSLMSTHPATPERIARAVATARQFGAPGIIDAGRDAWLSVIDNIQFGDDPSEGAIRGTRFFHSRLGFELTAPQGFALENVDKALLGLARGGAEALRLDSVQAPNDAQLDTYLDSGWVEGLQKSSVRTTSIHELPAALATAKSGGWSFRVAVVRLGSELYRLIFAARNLDEATDKRFVDSIHSFRRLTTAEIAALRPLRIQVVSASATDTAETLAARMQTAEAPIETFRLLNGLEKTTPVKPRERYKIVSE